ncbi:uncharacterized protein LOC143036493 isoform X2 [Oratosquilla oratoria]|uniref:uncharacterized protein LOC143036493 isoform X2 n=1 Tax=Oratosquilla oratoria TaxID=337810 RepID=UPI003F758A8F
MLCLSVAKSTGVDFTSPTPRGRRHLKHSVIILLLDWYCNAEEMSRVVWIPLFLAVMTTLHFVDILPSNASPIQTSDAQEGRNDTHRCLICVPDGCPPCYRLDHMGKCRMIIGCSSPMLRVANQN